MLFVYRFLTIFFYPIFILIIYLRKFFKKEDKFRYKEKIFNTEAKPKNNKKLIWFHGASIGEIKSIFPVIERLNKKNKYNFLITTITLSAGNLVVKTFKKKPNISHKYLPLDIEFLIKNFLNTWKPKLVFFVDSEIWPNLILELKKRKIHSILINGRITNKTFKKWMIISGLAKKVFSSFALCLPSSQESKKYLKKLNTKNIKYIGNLKLTGSVNLNLMKNRNKNMLSKKRTWCAVSTHDNEEVFCLKTHLLIKKFYKNFITIIIPRHTSRSEEIKNFCNKFRLTSQILNEGELILKDKEIIIINSFGNVSKFLKFTNSVFMGKSIAKKFKSFGGQNPIEAAKMGCKVYHGPYINNFKEVYQLLSRYKVSEKIQNEIELSKKLMHDFKNPRKDKKRSVKIINDLGKKILDKSINEINKIYT